MINLLWLRSCVCLSGPQEPIGRSSPDANANRTEAPLETHHDQLEVRYLYNARSNYHRVYHPSRSFMPNTPWGILHMVVACPKLEHAPLLPRSWLHI